MSSVRDDYDNILFLFYKINIQVFYLLKTSP